MRVFLAGATGAVGRWLVPMLLQSGHEVFGGSRSASGLEQLRAQGAKPIHLDVFDRQLLADTLRNVSPDAVIHQLTALSTASALENARIRVEGTRNLVDAALAIGITRLVAQSIAWAYEPGTHPAPETTPLDLGAVEPRATTIRGVCALEAAASELSEHVVLRYGTFYGPGTWYAPGGLTATGIRSGELAANDSVTSFIHVHDAARAAVQALAWPRGVYNVVDDEPARARDWVPRLAEVQGIVPPAPTAGRAPWARGADNALARRLGWHPRYGSWRVGFTVAHDARNQPHSGIG